MIKVGVVGCGYWGPNLIRNFNQLETACMFRACDVDEKKLEKIKTLYPNVKTTTEYNELLDNNEIQAIAIATPVATHFELAKKALKAGKHVLVEKPITSNSKEAKKLIQLAQEQNRKLMVDHTFEYCTPVNKIKEVVKGGELGKIFTINVSRLNLGLFQPDINVIWDLAPHDISIMLYILEKKPISVSAVGEAHVQRGIEDDAHVYLEFGGKTTGAMHLSWLDPCKVRRTVVVGSKKMLLFDDTEISDKIKIFNKGVEKMRNGKPIIKYYETFEQFQYLYRNEDTYIPKLELKEPLKIMTGHFIDCIENDKKPRSDGESGLRVVEIIEAAQKSLKQRGESIKIE